MVVLPGADGEEPEEEASRVRAALPPLNRIDVKTSDGLPGMGGDA
jgi:hypothetical protein